MGRGVSCVSLFLVCLLQRRASLAQAPPDLPNFRAGTTLVEFTVVVTGEDGRHVTDLKQEDVSIVEGGHPRDVAFFHYEGAPPAAIRVRAQPLPPGIYTNRPEYAPGPPRNITAILIDSLNTRAEDQVKVLAHILAFVSAVPSDTRVAIYRTGERVHVIHDFTDDVEGLRKRLMKDGLEAPRDNQQGVAVQQMVIEPWQAEAMAATMEASLEVAYQEMAGIEERSNQYMESRRVEFTMSSLEAVGNHLAGIPGRKNLIWMTSGVPAISAQTRDPWPQNYIASLRRVAQRLASQGIAMYPVEAAGVRPLYLNVTAGVRGSTRGVEDLATSGDDAIARTAARVEARQRARGATQSPSQMSTTPDAPAHGRHDGSVRRPHRRPRAAQHQRPARRRQGRGRRHARHIFGRFLCAAGDRRTVAHLHRQGAASGRQGRASPGLSFVGRVEAVGAVACGSMESGGEQSAGLGQPCASTRGSS